MVKEGRWDKSGVDHAQQEALAKEAKRRGIPEWQIEMSRTVGNDVWFGIWFGISAIHLLGHPQS